MMKFGFDIHDTIDSKPELFAKLTHRLVMNGNEVHIITGSMQTPQVESFLADIGIEWTHFFSVSDYLIANGHAVEFSDPGNPWFDADVWDRAKGEYCYRMKIDLHIDDSDVYEKYFRTPYLRFKKYE